MKIVITGITGSLGRMVAERLLSRGHEVLGIDRRPWPDAPTGIEMHRVDIRKRPAEDVFRTQRPDALIHMATVTHFTTRFEERYRINMQGTRKLLSLCDRYGVKQFIFVGRHTIYGAAGDAALYRTEDEPPMAVSTFPELADLCAADLYAGTALWRLPDLATSVLRIVYTLGPTRRGTLANFLGGQRVPMVMGFDPLYHLMHERDAAEAILLAFEQKIRGVYNVAGPSPVPLSVMCKVTGVPGVPIPEFMYTRALGRFGFPRMPAGVVAHIKYPVVVDGSLFAETTGFAPSYDEFQAMESFRWL